MDVAKHYNMLIEENDPYRDQLSLHEYMEK